MILDKFSLKGKVAIVTGSDTGLGQGFSKAFVEAGAKVMGVSVVPSTATQEMLGEENFHFMTENLMTNEPIERIIEKTIADFGRVDILVNNAGLGGSRRIDDVPLKYIDTIIQVNVAAMAILTHELVGNLKRNAASYVLNISSMAGLIPTGYKTVYPASKAFVKHFSLGMREELKPYGISVSFAVLGPMPTRQEIISRINRQGWIGKSLSVSPEKVARICVRKMFRKVRTIVPGKLNSLSFHLIKLIPEHLRGMLMSKSVRKNEL